MVLQKLPIQAVPFTLKGTAFNCVVELSKFDRDERTIGLVFIIYRVLSVYVSIGLTRWMCEHTFEFVRGRWRLNVLRY